VFCVCVSISGLQHTVLGTLLMCLLQVVPPLVNRLTVDRPLNLYEMPLGLRAVHIGHLDTTRLVLNSRSAVQVRCYAVIDSH
jgi:hypothetical protein